MVTKSWLRRIPLLAEEGWRDSAGVVSSAINRMPVFYLGFALSGSRFAPPRPRRFGGSRYFLLAQPPLLREEGNTSPQGFRRSDQFGAVRSGFGCELLDASTEDFGDVNVPVRIDRKLVRSVQASWKETIVAEGV